MNKFGFEKRCPSSVMNSVSQQSSVLSNDKVLLAALSYRAEKLTGIMFLLKLCSLLQARVHRKGSCLEAI